MFTLVWVAATTNSVLHESLHDAAAAGRPAAVRRLIDHGGLTVDVPHATTGETALYLAASNGHLRTVKLLCELGASPHAAEVTGFTPLHAAASRGDAPVVAVLLQAGAQVDAPDRRGRRPLHVAAVHDRVEVVAMLCGRGAPVAAVDHNGNTALHVAASANVAHELLQAGGPSLALLLNRWNDSAMHEAAWRGQTDVLMKLAELVPSPALGLDERGPGADTTVPPWVTWDGNGGKAGAGSDHSDDTPLVLAARQGHVAATRVLLQHAFCVRATSGAFTCPSMRQPEAKRALARLLSTAEQAGQKETAELLRKSGARHPSPTPSVKRRHSGSLTNNRNGDGSRHSDSGDDAQLSEAWATAAEALPQLSRQLLIQDNEHGVDAADLLLERARLDTLSAYRGAREALHVDAASALYRRPAALDAAACAELRRRVDEAGDAELDTVDGLPAHQVELTKEDLQALVGAAAAAELLALPTHLLPPSATPSSSPSSSPSATPTKLSRATIGGSVEGLSSSPAAVHYAPSLIFARRYSASTRPWIGFHNDDAAITVNVALSHDSNVTGGDLIGLYGGGIHRIARAQGEASVHRSSLLHGVTRVRHGTRYSLILFFSPATVGEASISDNHRRDGGNHFGGHRAERVVADATGTPATVLHSSRVPLPSPRGPGLPKPTRAPDENATRARSEGTAGTVSVDAGVARTEGTAGTVSVDAGLARSEGTAGTVSENATRARTEGTAGTVSVDAGRLKRAAQLRERGLALHMEVETMREQHQAAPPNAPVSERDQRRKDQTQTRAVSSFLGVLAIDKSDGNTWFMLVTCAPFRQSRDPTLRMLGY